MARYLIRICSIRNSSAGACSLGFTVSPDLATGWALDLRQHALPEDLDETDMFPSVYERIAALTLAKDLGFNSQFCQAHVQPIDALVDHAFAHDPTYASLITKLWTDFVSYLGGDAAAGKFDKGSYVGELYILTLAKLICANVLNGKALISDDAELQAILDGSLFKARGLPNLVEYDYFGWLNASPYVNDLVAVARHIQDDLRAYDFESSPAEDLFGTLMAQLAARSQRLLLGQEWTPSCQLPDQGSASTAATMGRL